MVAFSPQCHRSEIKFDSLSLDQQAAMADAKRQFHQLETNISNEDSVFQVIQNFKNLSILEGQQARRSLVISYSMATGKVRAEQGTNFHRWNYNRHLAKLAPSIVSLGGFSLPDGMSMLFMDGDQSGLATLVYTDGRVIMKPKVCLTRPDELVAVARLAEMLEEANKKENDYLKERERQIDLKRHQKDLERSLIMEERKRQEIERKKHEHGQPHE